MTHGQTPGISRILLSLGGSCSGPSWAPPSLHPPWSVLPPGLPWAERQQVFSTAPPVPDTNLISFCFPNRRRDSALAHARAV